MRILMVFLLLAMSQMANAQDCASVIALSKVKATTVSSKNSIEAAAASFCNEYASAKASGKSMTAGASYYAISGNFGSSSSSMEQVASKYCSSSNSYNKADDAYQQYVENIAPGAYGAYQQCLMLAGSDVKFGIDEASILPKQMVLTVNYAASVAGAGPASFQFATSDDVSCAWVGNAAKKIALSTGQAANLSCKRTNQGVKSFVTVTRVDGGSKIALPWAAYSAEGIPVNALLDLTQTIAVLQQKLDAVSSAGIGTQSGLNSLNAQFATERASINYTIVPLSGSCPNGWTRLGTIGFIVQNPDYGPANLGQGGTFNDGWTWTHPQLCRR